MIKYFLRILEDDIAERQEFLRSTPLDPRADAVERKLNKRMRTYVLLTNYAAKRKERAK